MEATVLKREFKFEKDGTKVTLPDPNPNLTTQEVMQYYSNQYPELTTARVEAPKTVGNTAVFNIVTTVGTKG